MPKNVTIVESAGKFWVMCEGKAVQSWFMPFDPEGTINAWLEAHAALYKLQGGNSYKRR